MEQAANKCASASYLYAPPASKPTILLPVQEHVSTGELHFNVYYIPRPRHLCKQLFFVAVNSRELLIMSDVKAPSFTKDWWPDLTVSI